MSNAVALAVRVTSETSDAVAGFDAVSASAKSMGDGVEDAARKSDNAVSKLDGAADSAGNLDSKAAAATGALGALSSGFELVGAEQYAGALQGAALATDFFSGIGQAATLVLESERLAQVKNTAATVLSTAKTAIASAATATWTAIQWAFNAAMSANPVALVVIAIIALVAIVVIAYKKSDRFKAAIDALGRVAQKVFGAMKAAFAKVRDAASSVFDWIKSHWKLILAILAGPFGLAALAIAKNWDKIKDGARKVIDTIKSVFAWSPVPLLTRIWAPVERILKAPFVAVQAFIGGLFGDNGALVNVVRGVVGTITGIINGIISAINRAIDAINKVPGVNVGHIPGVSSYGAGPAARGAVGRSAAPRVAGVGATSTVQITVNGAIDPYATAGQIERILARRGVIVGRR